MSNVKPITPAEADLAYAAAQRVVETHRRLAALLRPGLTLAQIDQSAAQILESLDCRSAFLGYRAGRLPPFPSHACLSVNECVVHGTAGYYTQPLKTGDVLKIDIGVIHKGWIGDAAWTYVFGEPSKAVEKLCRAGKESLSKGVQQLKPGNTLLAWAKTVQGVVEKEHGLHLVRGLGGHGYRGVENGKPRLHAPPYVANTVPTFPGEWSDANQACTPGMLIAVEPMIAIGTGETAQQKNQWPVFSRDGSLTAHYEHDVLITESGPKVLTEGLEEVRDVIA